MTPDKQKLVNAIERRQRRKIMAKTGQSWWQVERRTAGISEGRILYCWVAMRRRGPWPTIESSIFRTWDQAMRFVCGRAKEEAKRLSTLLPLAPEQEDDPG